MLLLVCILTSVAIATSVPITESNPLEGEYLFKN